MSRPCSRASWWLRWLLPLVVGACSGTSPHVNAQFDTPEAHSPDEQIHRLAPNGHPGALLIARRGDPASGVAVALTVRGERGASLRLALAVSEALSRKLPGVAVIPNDEGAVLTRLVTTGEEARLFVELTTHLLGGQQPLPKESVQPEPSRKPQRRRTGARPSAGQRALARCTAQFPVATQRAYGAAPSSQSLDELRQDAFAAGSLAFAAVGQGAVIDALADSLQELSGWSTPELPPADWPTSDAVFAEPTPGDERSLDVAWFTPDPERAILAGRALAAGDAPWLSRIRARAGRFNVTSVTGNARLRGGCVGAHLSGPAGDPSPELGGVATLARAVSEELHAAVAAAEPTPEPIAASLVAPSDPRIAAAAAAWRSLSQPADAPARRIVLWTGPGVAPDQAKHLGRALSQLPARSPLDLRYQDESGQAQLWVTVASPCSSLGDGVHRAGATALALYSLAAAASGRDAVTIEPWITAEGAGLIAHASAAPGESIAALAGRVVERLGRSVEPTGLRPADFDSGREALLSELGSQRSSGWNELIDQLSGGWLGGLSTRGRWSSVTGLGLDQIRNRAARWAAEPLRAAALLNGGPMQEQAVAGALRVWFHRSETERTSCPDIEPAPARHGRVVLEARASSGQEASYVGFRLPSPSERSAELARWTTWLLNRPGGWLERALAHAPAASARARLLSGPGAGALVVELRAPPEGLEPAVEQLRGLFARLSAGAVSRREAEQARSAVAALEFEADLDPRQRLVGLWSHEAPKPQLGPSDLKKFHAAAFLPAREVVVVVRTAD